MYYLCIVTVFVYCNIIRHNMVHNIFSDKQYEIFYLLYIYIYIYVYN